MAVIHLLRPARLPAAARPHRVSRAGASCKSTTSHPPPHCQGHSALSQVPLGVPSPKARLVSVPSPPDPVGHPSSALPALPGPLSAHFVPTSPKPSPSPSRNVLEVTQPPPWAHPGQDLLSQGTAEGTPPCPQEGCLPGDFHPPAPRPPAATREGLAQLPGPGFPGPGESRLWLGMWQGLILAQRVSLQQTLPPGWF